MINIKELLNLTYYTSELDEFLAEYEKSHPQLSPSQKKEIEKYKRVFELRDETAKVSTKKEFWDKF